MEQADDLPAEDGAETLVLRETPEQRALVCLALGARFWRPRVRRLLLTDEPGPVADESLEL